MKTLVALLRSEPSAIGGLVSAAVSLAASFGLGLSADQTGAVVAVVAAFVALVVRSQVTPTVSGPPPQAGQVSLHLVAILAAAVSFAIFALDGFGALTVTHPDGWLGLGLLLLAVGLT